MPTIPSAVLPWLIGGAGLLVVVGVVWVARRIADRRRRQAQEWSRMRTFAAVNATRADDLSVKIDHQQAEVASLTARLKAAQATISELRERLHERSDERWAATEERIAELEAENQRLRSSGAGTAPEADATTLEARLEEQERRHLVDLDQHVSRIDLLEAENAELRRRVEGEPGPDTAELIRLRTRVLDLERAKADLEMRRDELMQRMAVVVDVDVDAMRERISTLEGEIGRLRRGATPGRVIDLRSEEASVATADPGLDGDQLAEAEAILGYRPALDDLQVIGGIGPKIERLCHGIGIRTWQDLATADADALREMLAEAGPGYRAHDPESWIHQASLLVEHRWEEFQATVAEARAGRRR